MKRDGTVFAERCPHCGKSIAMLHPIGEKTLAAARALLLEDVRTSKDVAEIMGISPGHASMLLHRAGEAGLISKKERIPSHRIGGAAYVYTPSQRLRAYAPVAYKQWEISQRHAITKKIA